MEQTLDIKTKKLQFGIGNEVSGWFKTIDGAKTKFKIRNDGEVEQSGNPNEVHPFILGLCELLFTVE